MQAAVTRKLRGPTGFIGASLAQKIIALAILPVYAHILGNAEFGQAALLTTIFLLGQSVFTLGLDTVLYWSAGNLRLEEDRSRPRASEAIAGLVFIPLSACLLLLGSSVALFWLLSTEILGIPAYVLTLELAAACLYTAIYVPVVCVFRIQGRPLSYGLVLMSFVLVQNGVKLIFFTASNMGIVVWALGDLVGAGFVAVVSCVALKRYSIASGDVRGRWVAEALRKGAPLVPSRLAQWGITSSDRTVIANQLGTASLAPYAAANQLFVAAMTFVIEICRYCAPSYARAQVDVTSPSRKTDLTNLLWYQTAAVCSLAVSLGAAGPAVLSILYPPDFITAVPVLFGLACATIFVGLGYILIDLLTVGLGRNNQVWIFNLIGLLVMLAINISLLRHVGIVGAAIAAIGAYGVILSLLLIQSLGCLRQLQYPLGRSAALVGLSILIIAASAAAVEFFNSNYASFAGIPLGVVIIAVLNRGYDRNCPQLLEDDVSARQAQVAVGGPHIKREDA